MQRLHRLRNSEASVASAQAKYVWDRSRRLGLTTRTACVKMKSPQTPRARLRAQSAYPRNKSAHLRNRHHNLSNISPLSRTRSGRTPSLFGAGPYEATSLHHLATS